MVAKPVPPQKRSPTQSYLRQWKSIRIQTGVKVSVAKSSKWQKPHSTAVKPKTRQNGYLNRNSGFISGIKFLGLGWIHLQLRLFRSFVYGGGIVVCGYRCQSLWYLFAEDIALVFDYLVDQLELRFFEILEINTPSLSIVIGYSKN